MARRARELEREWRGEGDGGGVERRNERERGRETMREKRGRSVLFLLFYSLVSIARCVVYTLNSYVNYIVFSSMGRCEL